jgi:hypothetical protein
MADQIETRTLYRTRIVLEIDAPPGETAWTFTTIADEIGVAVSQVAAVKAEPKP